MTTPHLNNDDHLLSIQTYLKCIHCSTVCVRRKRATGTVSNKLTIAIILYRKKMLNSFSLSVPFPSFRRTYDNTSYN